MAVRNPRIQPEESNMAKKGGAAVYRVVDVIGISTTSWEDAARNAVKTAAKSLRDLRIAEVTKMDVKVDNGKVTAFRTRLALSFKYEG
jgi:hypothetical protein